MNKLVDAFESQLLGDGPDAFELRDGIVARLLDLADILTRWRSDRCLASDAAQWMVAILSSYRAGVVGDPLGQGVLGEVAGGELHKCRDALGVGGGELEAVQG